MAAYTTDDFETAGNFSTRANWTGPDGAAAANALEAINGYAHNKNQYGATNTALFGPDLGRDFVAHFGYDQTGRGEPDTGYDGQRQFLMVWYKDAANYVSAQVDRGNNRVTLSVIVNGNQADDPKFDSPFAIPVAGKLTVQSVAGSFRVAIENRWLNAGNQYAFPFDAKSLTGSVSESNRGGKAGFAAGTWRYAVLNDIVVKPIDISIDFIDGFVGRDSLTATGGTATMELALYGATPTRFVGRVFDWVTGALVQDWTDLGDSSEVAPSGSVRKTIFLPTGGPYSVEAGYVGADGKTHVARSRRVLSGRRILVSGQSNAANRAGGLAGNVAFLPQAATAVETGNMGVPGYVPVDGGIASTREWAQLERSYVPSATIGIANTVAAILGQPVGVQTLAKGSTGIDYLTNGQGWTDIQAGLAYGKGIVEALVWDQGENDADGAGTPNTYANLLAAFLAKIRTATGNQQLPMFIAGVGRFASANAPYGTFAQNDANREVLRQQQLAATGPRVMLSSFKLGAVHSDAYHYTSNAYVEICRRDGLTVAAYLSGAGSGGQGPKPTSFALASGRIGFTIDVDLDGASGLTDLVQVNTGAVPAPSLAGGLYGYQISADNFATLLPIATLSVDRSGPSPRLTGTLASAAPAGTLKVRSFYGSSYDDTQLFYGTRDGGNIPIRPIITPLAAS